MFAIIRTGGKQYRVAKDDRLEVAKMDAKEGDTVKVELIATTDGKKVDFAKKGAQISAKVIENTRDDKIVVFKKKRRQGYRRTKGHHQDITVIEIADIKAA
ncbi:MAG: 50S ribosomal protein L21 [Pseudomonadota bacterium]